tara:strand:+ start:162 stop:296 length:135 start_codon:yes stop_codon:yes gene_type:complete
MKSSWWQNKYTLADHSQAKYSPFPEESIKIDPRGKAKTSMANAD